MPIAATSVFYAGVKWGWADGHLVWFVLALMGVGLIGACGFIPEKAAGDVPKKARGSERDGVAEDGEGEGEGR